MLFTALLVTPGLGASIPATAVATTPTTTPITATNTGVTLLWSSPQPLFGVLEVLTSPRRGHPSVALLSTRDFVHFTNITPPGPPSEGGTIGGWSSASFPTPADGWVAEANADYSEGFLFHTTDGGITWQLTRPLWSGSAGTASVSFINAADGWLKAGDIGDGTLTFSATTDGGATWKTLLEEGTFNTDLDLAMPSFSDAEDGTGVISSPGQVVSSPPKFPPELSVDRNTVEATTDGGAAWFADAVPVAAHGVHFFNEPFFSGPNGVLAVTVTPRNTRGIGRATVDFDTTTDGGKVWTSHSRLVSAAVPKVVPQGPDASGLPSVSEATTRSWWILAVAPSGKISTYVTSDAGRNWVKPSDASLPLVPLEADVFGGALPPASVQAVSSKIAIATVWTSPESTPSAYITLDGGSKWTR